MQTPDPTEILLQQRIKEANARKAETEAKAAEIETEKDAFELRKSQMEAQIPTGTGKPRTGKMTASEGFGYLGELTAYYTLNEAAEQIADGIDKNQEDTSPQSILMLDTLESNTPAELLSHFRAQLEDIISRIEAQEKTNGALLKTPPEADVQLRTAPASLSLAAGLATALGVVNVISDIYGFFRADYQLIGRKVALSTLALRAAVAGALQKKGKKVYLHPLQQGTESKIVGRFVAGLNHRHGLQKHLAALKTLQGPDGNTSAPPKAVAQAVAESEVLIEAFDAFAAAATTRSDGQRFTPLRQAAVQEWIAEHTTHLLYVDVASGGGETIAKEGKDKFSFQGGGAYTYILTASDTGAVVSAGNHLGWAMANFTIGHDKITFGIQSIPPREAPPKGRLKRWFSV